MTPKKYTLNALFNRLVKGIATKEEKETAEEWYSRLDLTRDEALFGSAEEELGVQERIRANLHAHVHQNKIWKLSTVLSFQKVAALLCFAVMGLGILGYMLKNRSLQKYHIASGDKNIRKLTLPDGTMVTLNLGSSIHWKSDYNTSNRNIDLIGEAYFDVKKDKKRPFIVHTGNLRTIVLGTAFTVEAYPKDHHLKVALIRGRVKIENKANDSNRVFLLPGNTASYDPELGKIDVKPTAVESPEAWIYGSLVFNDIPLAAAIERLRIKYHLNILYNEHQMENKKITASFEAVSWQEALHSILFTNGMKYIIKDNTIYIISN